MSNDSSEQYSAGNSSSSRSTTGGFLIKYDPRDYESNVPSEPEQIQINLQFPQADEEDFEKLPAKERIVRLLSIGELSRSSVETEPEVEQNCPQYFDIASFAQYLINDIINEAEGIINEHVKEMPLAIRALPSKDKISTLREYDDFPFIMHSRPKFSCWPTIREFTIELGAGKIDEYLSSFTTNEEWLYIIYYLGAKTENTSKCHEYQATWSLPSPEYPIAQATASVFFTIEVSEVIPIDCLVTVTFTFEGHQFRHTPGLIDFNEDWLNYILDSKIDVFKKIKF